MTTQQIEQQIQDEYKKFQTAKFEETLPKGIIEKFKKAIKSVAPNSHQLHPKTIRDIVGKKEKDLTNLEVGFIIKAIIDTPLEKIFGDDFGKSIDELEKILDLNVACNVADAKKKEELYQRKATLLSLAGANNGTAPKNILAKA